MIPYLLCYLIAPLLFGAAVVEDKKKHKGQAIILILLSVLVLILFGTIRSVDVGTDVKVYQLSFFENAKQFRSFVKYCYRERWSSKEYGYLLVTFICSKLSSSIHFLFFILQVLAVGPIYYVVWKFRSKCNAMIAVLAYCFIFHSETFNTIRQNIAVSIAAIAITLFLDKKYLKSLITVLVASTFHLSALIVLLIVPIRFFSEKKSTRKEKIRTYIKLGILVFAVTFFFRDLYLILRQYTTLMPSRYLDYFTDKVDIQVITSFESLICFVISILIVKKRKYTNDAFYYFLVMASTISLSFFYISSVSSVISRIAWYFQIFNIFNFSNIPFLFKRRKENLSIIFMLLYLFFAIAWWYYYAYIGNASVYPYSI